MAKILAIGNLPDGRRELLRLELPNASYGLGEAVNHDPLVLSLVREADRKGHSPERTWKKGRPKDSRLALDDLVDLEDLWLTRKLDSSIRQDRHQDFAVRL
jgi:hypothetical protein